MQPALFDSSVYISALRRGDDAAPALRRLAADAPLWLSAVVIAELYAGAGDREGHVENDPDDLGPYIDSLDECTNHVSTAMPREDGSVRVARVPVDRYRLHKPFS
jgi:hypothetical protein